MSSNYFVFKFINWVFAVIHLSILIACFCTVYVRDGPLIVYYQIVLTHGQLVDVYPIYVALVTHSVALLFHFIFALTGSSMVNEYIAYNYANPIRWIMQFFVDGSSLVALMLIHGFYDVGSVVLVIMLFAATIALNYLQDQYLNTDKAFFPDRQPHTFGIPLYIAMILVIVAKSSDHINDKASIRIAIVTIVSLFQTLIGFLIQKAHINFSGNKAAVDDEVFAPVDVDTAAERDLENIIEKGEQLDLVMDEISRGVKYESFHYINSTLFTLTITWVVINITRNDQILN